MEQQIHFYQAPGLYTDPKEFRQLLASLPNDHLEIIRFIKKVLIHPTDARNCGVRFDYKKTLRSQVDHRSVDDILANPKVNALLRPDTLDFESTPSQRGILSCDHHAVLFASILRLKGRAVRLRCGYAAYIVPEKLTPHWICEVQDEETLRWVYIDSERALLGLDEQSFSSGGKVWLDARAGKLELDHVLPDYRDGLNGIKYRLLSDVNALMKNELLSYEWMIREATPKAPGLFSKGTLKLDRAEWDLLDRLAALSVGVDAHWTGLCRLYASYVHAENLRIQPGETEAGLRSK